MVVMVKQLLCLQGELVLVLTLLKFFYIDIQTRVSLDAEKYFHVLELSKRMCKLNSTSLLNTFYNISGN